MATTPEEVTMENRRAIVSVPHQVIIDLLTNAPTRYECPSIPPGSTVVAVTTDFASGSFLLMIEHESFAPVPMGEEIPRVNGPLNRWGLSVEWINEPLTFADVAPTLTEAGWGDPIECGLPEEPHIVE